MVRRSWGWAGESVTFRLEENMVRRSVDRASESLTFCLEEKMVRQSSALRKRWYGRVEIGPVRH